VGGLAEGDPVQDRREVELVTEVRAGADEPERDDTERRDQRQGGQR
jgi:hypothetical protein